jgi:hypothetical protein
MAETMNRKAQLAVARVEVPAKRNDAQALPCGIRDFQAVAKITMESAMERGNRLILLAD